MVVKCEIEFENNLQGTFYAGQLLSGCVILRADKPKDVSAVLLKVVGYSVTKWTERGVFGSKVFVGRDDYIDSDTYLLGTEDSTSRQTIQAGVHTYNFACQLPKNAPSSFEGRYGCIRYIVKVMLKRPWKFDQTYTRGFTLLKLFDLNFEPPQLRLPANSEAYRTFCCGPCKTEPLKIELHLPQAGYVPGQLIPVTAVIINNTSYAVSEVKMSLIMMVRYQSQLPKNGRVEYVTVSKAKGDSVLRSSTRSYTVDLSVPATPPTCTSLCKLIQIAYHIEVEAKVGGCVRESQTMLMPVTIGTVPLELSGIVTQQPTMRQQRISVNDGKFTDGDELPVITTISATANVLTPDAGDLPPPTYTEAMHTVRGNINEDEVHAFGPNEFAPLYPVYSIPSPTLVNATNEQNLAYVNKGFVK